MMTALQRRNWLITIASAMILLAVQFLVQFPLARLIDVPLWDESNYMGQGDAFMTGIAPLPLVGNSPLYALAYGALARLVGTVDSIYWMRYALTLSATLLIFLLLRRYVRSLTFSVLLTVIWIVSDYNVNQLDGFPLVDRLGFIIFLLALLYADRNRLVVIVLMALAALARPEYALVLGFYLLACLFQLARRSVTINVRALLSPMLWISGALLIFTLINLEGWTSEVDRLWFAFEQHYANRQVDAGRFDVNPWSDYGVVISADFPDAASLPAAALTNPVAFSRHVYLNAVRVIPELLRFVMPAARIGNTYSVLAIGVVAAVSLACALLSQRREWMGEFGRLNRLANPIHALGLIAIIGALPSLFVTAGARYMLALVPFIFIYVGFALQATASAFSQESRWRDYIIGTAPLRTAQGAVVVLLLIALGSQSLIRKIYPDETYPVRNLVTQMGAMWPDDGSQVVLFGVGSSSYCNYIGQSRCEAYEPFPTTAGLAVVTDIDLEEALAQSGAEAIVVNRELIRSVYFESLSGNLLSRENWRSYSFGPEQIFYDEDARFLSKPVDVENDVPPGLTVNSNSLHADLGFGWFEFEIPNDARWMRTPGELLIYAADYLEANIAVNPLLMKSGNGIGTSGVLEFWIDGEQVAETDIESEMISSAIVPLKPGWNSVELVLADGNLPPINSDYRSLSVSFHTIDITLAVRDADGEIQQGLDLTPGLEVAFNAGWHDWEQDAGVRWMEEASTLAVTTEEAVTIQIDLTPASMNVSNTFGSEGEMSISVNGESLSSGAVASGANSTFVFDVPAGINLVTLDYFGGDFVPAEHIANSADSRRLGIAFFPMTVSLIE